VKEKISGLFDIPLDHVRVLKARPFKLQDTKLIPNLDWFGLALKPHSTLGGFPWRYVSK